MSDYLCLLEAEQIQRVLVLLLTAISAFEVGLGGFLQVVQQSLQVSRAFM